MFFLNMSRCNGTKSPSLVFKKCADDLDVYAYLIDSYHLRKGEKVLSVCVSVFVCLANGILVC